MLLSSHHKLKTMWPFSHQLHVTSTSPANLSMLVRIRSRVAISLVASSIFWETKLPARQVKNLSDTCVLARWDVLLVWTFQVAETQLKLYYTKEDWSAHRTEKGRGAARPDRGARRCQQVLLPAAFHVWSRALLPQTGCLRIGGRRSQPTPSQHRDRGASFPARFSREVLERLQGAWL